MGFDGAPDTLQERLNAEQWSKRYKVKAFNHKNTFVELRLTKSDSFPHHRSKLLQQGGKHHCALCYHCQM
jgi:hypothetical protein